MSLGDELKEEVRAIASAHWNVREGRVVPDEDSLGLGNEGITLNATVLYADLSDSTKLVDSEPKQFSAEIYKAFLRCSARIINSEGGTITAYDGDRVMAVFVGDSKNTTAVRTGLKINWACKNIIKPAFEFYKKSYVLKHVVGIDTSELLVARAGVRGANDLVWIGQAANHAAKLCNLDHEYPTWITDSIYSNIAAQAKYSNGVDMWEARSWTAMNNRRIYRSTYWWSI